MSNSPLTTAEQQSRQIVEALVCPSAYSDGSSSVELIETHISWVFLTESVVYKMKKPLRLDFLDYGSIAERHRMCQQEVALNRRLAPQVYLGVCPVTKRGAGFQVGGDGEAVDWLVKMRRLPAEAAMDARLLAGQWTGQAETALANLLVRFYRDLPAAPRSPATYVQHLVDHVRDNAAALTDLCDEADRMLVQRLTAAQLGLLHSHPQILEQRARTGRVVNGHGDLRPEHVYFLPEPVVIDCLEFSQELREVDLLDELCFLEMECDLREHGTVGRAVREHVQQAMGDHADPLLPLFYKCYRACVRAKVEWIRAHQPHGAAARSLASQHIQAAERYAAGLPRGPLILVRGAMGSGKSTLAAGLARRLGATHLSTDQIRRERHPSTMRPVAYGSGRYTRAERSRIYDAMLHRAESLLAQGQTVVLDGSFAFREWRTQARRIAGKHERTLLQFHCECPEAVARQRITARLDAGPTTSEARPEWLRAQLVETEPAQIAEGEKSIDTTESAANVLRTALTLLRHASR